MSTVDQLFKEAAELPEDQKLTLVNRLLASNEPSPNSKIDKEWDVAIRDRIKAYDKGTVNTRSAGEVFSDLDKKLIK
jgi:hypothetical protein